MRSVVLLLFVGIVAPLYALEHTTTMHIGGFTGGEASAWYDGWMRSVLFSTSENFEFKTKTIGGFSNDSAYATLSLYAEAGIPEFMAGFKTTFHIGDETGGFGKYGYPPMKELPALFFLDDFAYRDRFTITKNSEGVKEFVPVSTAYVNIQIQKFRFRTRTMYANPKNEYPADAIHNLQWFRDFTLETTYGDDVWSGGVLFLKGSVLDYCFKNIDRDLDGDGLTLDDKYKDTIVYGVSYKRTSANVAFYDTMGKYYYTSLRTTVPIGAHEYSLSAEVNELNRTTSVFLTQDYRRDVYGNVSYKNDDIDWFFAVADTEKVGAWSFTGMLCYRNVFSEGEYYDGTVGSLTALYSTSFGAFSCTVGTTRFTTVWDAWQIYPKTPKAVIAVSYECTF